MGNISLTKRVGRWLIMNVARTSIPIAPGFLIAAYTRMFLRSGVRRGEEMLQGGSFSARVLARTVSPFSAIVLDVGGKDVEVRALPWLTWFRSSVYFKLLSRNDLVELMSRASEKIRLRVLVPYGPQLPVALYRGVAADATGEILEWLIQESSGNSSLN